MKLLMEEQAMEGLTVEAKMKKAVAHTLRAISDDPRKYELMGLGTKTFSLLTEAQAASEGRNVADVRGEILDIVQDNKKASNWAS